MLIEHVKFKGRKVGTIVALDRQCVGWSQCCPRDTFNKDLGLKIAIGRALKGTKSRPTQIIDDALKKMQERAKKYYQ